MKLLTVISLFVIVIYPAKIFCQYATMVTDSTLFGPKPRMKGYGDSAGYYELAPRYESSKVINPGDTLDFSIYITGYGQILKSKIMIFSTGDIFDDSLSTLTYGIKPIPDDHEIVRQIGWGARVDTFTRHLNLIGMIAGVSHFGWNQETSYFDTKWKDNGSMTIMTELSNPNAPFLIHMKTKKDLAGGEYAMNVFFTYYNGKEWKGSQKVVTFKIRNLIERNESIVWFLGILATIGAITPGIKVSVKIVKRVWVWLFVFAKRYILK